MKGSGVILWQLHELRHHTLPRVSVNHQACKSCLPAGFKARLKETRVKTCVKHFALNLPTNSEFVNFDGVLHGWRSRGLWLLHFVFYTPVLNTKYNIYAIPNCYKQKNDAIGSMIGITTQ